MFAFPSLPESHGDLLQDTGNRDGKKSSQQTEKFCPGEEREDGHDGMHPDGFAEDVRGKNLPHENCLKKRHIRCHQECHHYPLGQSRQDTQHTYYVAADYRNKIKEKEECAQQRGVGNVQQRQPGTGRHCSYEPDQQISAQVSAQALIQGVQQEVNMTSVHERSFEAEPVNETRAINNKVHTERDHHDEVDDVGEQPHQKRCQP